jgi:hypothetical protein
MDSIARGLALQAKRLAEAAGGTPPSEFMEPVLQATDAAAARAALVIAEIDANPVNKVVSGGVVVWESGFTFRVSAAQYYVSGTLYTSDEQTITLNAADPTNPRIDVLVLTITGALAKITGVAAASASEPDIDPTEHVKLTFVLVDAAATAPTDVTNENVYLEDTEWTSTVSGSGLAKASTSNPYAGTKCIEATAAATNAYIQLVDAGNNILDSDAVLAFFLRSKATWANNVALRLQWYLSGVAKGTGVTISNGLWGFNSSQITTYQQIAIPIGQFQLAGAEVDRLRITVVRGPVGFYMDNIRIQTGGDSVSPPATPSFTQDQADARYVRQSKVVTLTQVAYDAIAAPDADTLYLIPEA